MPIVVGMHVVEIVADHLHHLQAQGEPDLLAPQRADAPPARQYEVDCVVQTPHV